MCQASPVKQLSYENVVYTAVVLYLVNLYRLRELLLSLSYLHQNVKMKPWPILLMYSDDLDDGTKRQEFMMQLYDYLGGKQEARWFVERIEWIRLDWSLPEGIPHNKDEVQPVFEHAWPGKSIA